MTGTQRVFVIAYRGDVVGNRPLAKANLLSGTLCGAKVFSSDQSRARRFRSFALAAAMAESDVVCIATINPRYNSVDNLEVASAR